VLPTNLPHRAIGVLTRIYLLWHNASQHRVVGNGRYCRASVLALVGDTTLLVFCPLYPWAWKYWLALENEILILIYHFQKPFKLCTYRYHSHSEDSLTISNFGKEK
jgi:hypothetical protein